jgi:hypothetical protein
MNQQVILEYRIDSGEMASRERKKSMPYHRVLENHRDYEAKERVILIVNHYEGP